MSIRKRILFWFLFPTILTAGMIVSVCYFYVKRTTEQNIFDQLELAAAESQEHIHMFLDEKKSRIVDFSTDGFIKTCTENIAHGVEVPSNTSRLNSHLILNKKPVDEKNIVEVFVVDLEGKVISSTEAGNIGHDVSDESFFSRVKEKGIFVNDIHYTSQFRQNTFEVSGILGVGEGKRPVGIIVNRYRGDSLMGAICSEISGKSGDGERLHGMGETGEVFIVNSDKLMITESRFVKGAILKQVVNTEGVNAAFENRGGMVGIYTNYRGIQVLGVSRYIDEMGWAVLAVKEATEAFSPLIQIRNLAIIIGVIGSMVVAIISIVVSREITRPIDMVIKGTKRIAGGNLIQPIMIGKRKDEIKVLAESFNLMMGKLKISNEENTRLMKEIERKGKEYIENLLETAHDAIVCVDEEGIINIWNQSAEKIFGYKKSEIIGQGIAIVVPGDILDGFLQMSKIIKFSKILEVSGKTKDGKVIPLEMSISSQKVEKGLHTFTMIIRDITFQKEAKKQLAEKADMLAKINRELEEFVYIVSHDLKEPLFTIEGYTSKLYRKYKNIYDDKGKIFTDRIRINVQLMSRKIQEIMNVLKIGRIDYDFRNNNSGTIVKDVVSSLEGRIALNGIKVEIEQNLPTVYCDERRMKDVFSNLVTNAIKFMGNGKATGTSYDQPIEELDGGLRSVKIGCRTDGDSYKFFVEDTGVGVRKEYQEQIFKIFRRLGDIESEGTGVGLAIVKKIVELHSGKLWVESPVEGGRGSRFCFTVPTARQISEN